MELAWDGTVTLGDALRILALIGSVVALIIAANRWQMKVEARITALDGSKVSKDDCTQSHDTVVTRDFCKAQHNQTNAGTEKLTEEFGKVAIHVARIQERIEWIMKVVEGLSQGGVRLANPHPVDLPPLPPGYPGDDDDSASES